MPDVRTLTRPTALLAIALLSALAIVITRPSPPATRLISRWTPQTIATQPDVHVGREGETAPPPITGQVVAAAAAMDITVDGGIYDAEREPLSAEIQEALAYTTARFGSGPRQRLRG